MHQVKLRRMPDLRTATGCRWRKTLDMTAMTRVRRSRGTPWRKIEFQTCELRTYSSGASIRSVKAISRSFWIFDSEPWIEIQIQNPRSKIQNPFIPSSTRQTIPDHPIGRVPSGKASFDRPTRNHPDLCKPQTARAVAAWDLRSSHP